MRVMVPLGKKTSLMVFACKGVGLSIDLMKIDFVTKSMMACLHHHLIKVGLSKMEMPNYGENLHFIYNL